MQFLVYEIIKKKFSQNLHSKRDMQKTYFTSDKFCKIRKAFSLMQLHHQRQSLRMNLSCTLIVFIIIFFIVEKNEYIKMQKLQLKWQFLLSI